MQKPQAIATWNPERDLWETSQEDIFGHSDVYSETFPKSGMTRAGQLYERPTSVPPTTGHGYSSSDTHKRSPTPKAADGIMGRPRTTGRPIEKSTHLGTIVTLLPKQSVPVGKHLPTPTASDATGGTRAKGKQGGDSLRTIAERELSGDNTPPLFGDGSE